MPIKLGNKADGEDFFDRVGERDDLWRYLEGNHIVLSGPRRLGKTSLLQRLAEEATEKGMLARLIDVEGIDTVDLGPLLDAAGEMNPESDLERFTEKNVAQVQETEIGAENSW